MSIIKIMRLSQLWCCFCPSHTADTWQSLNLSSKCFSLVEHWSSSFFPVTDTLIWVSKFLEVNLIEVNIILVNKSLEVNLLSKAYSRVNFLFIYLFFCFLGPHLQHMKVPKIGIKLELQLPTYTTATATRDMSCVCNLQHSSRQPWILNPLREARDWTRNLMIPSQIRFCCAAMGTLHM